MPDPERPQHPARQPDPLQRPTSPREEGLSDLELDLLPAAVRADAHVVLHRVRDLEVVIRAGGPAEASHVETITADLAVLADRIARARHHGPPDALPAVEQARAHIHEALRIVSELLRHLNHATELDGPR